MLYGKNFKKSIFNIGMFISCAATFLILLRPLIFDGQIYINKEQDMLTWLTGPMGTSGYLPFASIFPTLPYAFSYLEEKNSGYIKHIISRIGLKKYKLNKIFFTALSGGLAVAVPCFILFLMLSGMGAEVSEINYPYMYADSQYAPYLFVWGGRFVLIIKLIIIFLFGCGWALIALLISLLVQNRYMAFIIPFAIYQFGWILLTGRVLWIFNPACLFRGEVWAGYPLLTPIYVHIFYITLIITAIWKLMQRRIADD